MVSKSSKPAAGGSAASGSAGGGAADRAEQLAQALRDNLRRRKSQARARQTAEPSGEDPDAGVGGPPKPPGKA